MATDLLVEGLAIFAAVAVLQLPGKSNFGVITLATRHPHREVFVGATLGLSLATVISVTLGYGAETLLAPYLAWVKVAGGAVLVAFGVREILRGPGAIRGTEERELSRRQVWSLALGLTFLLEMGDTTQILAIVFVASTGNVVLVYLAVTAALVVVAAVSAAGARYLSERIPEGRLRFALGALLIVVGIATIVLTFWPKILLITG